jgi:acyl-CoA hydrolase
VDGKVDATLKLHHVGWGDNIESRVETTTAGRTSMEFGVGMEMFRKGITDGKMDATPKFH